jgi:hypothetical protein
MQAELYYGAREAALWTVQTIPSIVTKKAAPSIPRRISTQPLRKRLSGSNLAPKNAAEFFFTAAEEFSTSRWVRYRSEARRGHPITLQSWTKYQEINLLQSSCDQSTWHWVCNHNGQPVSLWNRSPLQAERSQAK